MPEQLSEEVSAEQSLQETAASAETAVSGASDLDALAELRVKYLGKKGAITAVLRGLGQLPQDARPRLGRLANEVRDRISAQLEEREEFLKRKSRETRLAAETMDITLPGRPVPIGRRHILAQTDRRVKEIFVGLGFEVAVGPEMESDYYNFEALNIPADHPAREMWDSFYLGDGMLLRTHTSPVQIRAMERKSPPLRVVSSGKCFRRDAVDATHSFMFHQLEGFMADRNVTFGDLKGILITFAREMFGKDRKAKFRPSYFPFTEPSAEMEIDCFACSGEGCRICHTGWLEILGCGMIHPRVLGRVGIDSEEYTGFAFGMGIERIAMLRHGIDDIRLFFENDIRFLAQF
ncbi:MAG: phenylalanine--tRNA ligase subunit alpha [Armatimonadetes bacterium]|nr:phenylalanine--tRNA ligase subunit alpha [Armatimonadota bacterium]